MAHTSQFCRAQEERQRLIARDAELPNSRAIAQVAAEAWAKEAASAEKREARGITLGSEDAAIAEEFRQEDLLEDAESLSDQ